MMSRKCSARSGSVFSVVIVCRRYHFFTKISHHSGKAATVNINQWETRTSLLTGLNDVSEKHGSCWRNENSLPHPNSYQFSLSFCVLQNKAFPSSLCVFLSERMTWSCQQLSIRLQQNKLQNSCRKLHESKQESISSLKPLLHQVVLRTVLFYNSS